jgi:hypothetical protein
MFLFLLWWGGLCEMLCWGEKILWSLLCSLRACWAAVRHVKNAGMYHSVRQPHEELAVRMQWSPVWSCCRDVVAEVGTKTRRSTPQYKGHAVFILLSILLALRWIGGPMRCPPRITSVHLNILNSVFELSNRNDTSERFLVAALNRASLWCSVRVTSIVLYLGKSEVQISISLLHILTEVSRSFSQFIHINCSIMPRIRPQLLA